MKYFLILIFSACILLVTSEPSYSSELPIGITDSCLFINGENVNVMTDPDSKAAVIMIEPYGGEKINLKLNTGYFCRILEVGKTETIEKVTSNWIKIQYQCQTGWVFAAYTIKAVEDSTWLKKNLDGEYICIFNDPEVCSGDGLSSILQITNAYGIINGTITEEVEGWTNPLSIKELSNTKLKGSCLTTGSEIFYFIKAEQPLLDLTQPIGFVKDWDFFLKTD